MATSAPRLRTSLLDNVVLRVALYYAALLAVAAIAWRTLLAPLHGSALPGALATADSLRGGLTAGRSAPLPSPTANPAATVALAMVSAVLLTLPVAWVYVLTRAKRGYQQSVVQTLVVLPTVVAGVVVLVKDSLALAFGLAGIIAAVRFRTALDDSKDAVYVFLATVIGLAAAVNLPAAVAISVVFNALILLLWATDFGRTPAHLDGRLAERRLRRAVEQLGRTGTFVARLDEDLFRDMTAEQLQAVADRAWRRARRHNPEPPDEEGRREALLRVRTADAAGSRRAIEPLLDSRVKQWRYGGVVHEADGVDVVEYAVQLRKSVPPAELLGTLREAGSPHVVGAELD